MPESIDVVSPADGFIVARNISPGQHYEHGMEFYRIADLSRVWVLAEVYEADAAQLHPGGDATVSLREGGRRWPARIANSLPQSETGGGTVRLRLEVENPGFTLRPEMLVDVELPVRLPPPPAGTRAAAPLCEPCGTPLLERILQQWLAFRLFEAMLHSVAGEHAARVIAMENSTTNLRRLESELTLLRNRARQAAITRELAEIVGGAEALA